MAIYEEYLSRRRWQPAHLSDKIPWRAIIAPGVVLQKQRHALQRTYAVRGPDMQGESPEVQGALMLQANQVLKRLGGRWMLQSEAQRHRVPTLPEIAWRHPIAALIDQERRQSLLNTPGSRETTYYLTLTWLPPTAATRHSLRFFLTGPGAPQHTASADEQDVSLREFVTQADYLMDLLRGMLAVCRPLTTEETLTYLHNCVSDRWHRVGRLASLTDIDIQLCDTPLVAGWYPQLGDWHVRTCTVTGYPAESTVGIVRALDAAEVDYRWCTRWMGLERHIQAGMLRKTQGAWVGQERSFMARVAESWSNQPTRVLNSDATNKAEDADAARQEIGADIVAYGEFTSTVTVWDEDPDVAEEKLQLVMQAFDSQGFVTTRELQHATAAWLSSHPGNRLDNVRRTPQHSLTLAHLCPGLTATWPGPERDAYMDGGPWFYAHTDQSTLFRVVNHIRDVGHMLVLGATGCHAPGTEILMYDGTIKQVENIQVGDQVMGPDSMPRNVIKLYRGKAEMARIMPVKGDPFEVTMNHVLSLKRTCRHAGDPLAGKIVNIAVREWLGKSPSFHHLHKLYRVGVEFPIHDGLPVAPYLLGVLLGDGAITSGSCSVTNPDSEIRNHVESLIQNEPFRLSNRAANSVGCPTYGFRHQGNTHRQRNILGQFCAGKNDLVRSLQSLGIYGLGSGEKHIPHNYKTGSKETRLQILAGLLDTDGSLGMKGYDYISKSKALAEDVCFLARSLGLAAYLTPCMKYCQTGGGGQYYRVSISGHTDMIPCQVHRKQAERRKQKKSALVTGIHVEPIGIGEYYGFECDGDHLYLMGDFTVTHNSGKSTLGNFLRSQWLQYPNTQAVLFDLDGHGRLLTYLLGGTWHDLGSPTLRFQPLRHINDPQRSGLAIQWLLDLLEDYHIPATASVQAYLGSNLRKLAQLPPDARTISRLVTMMADATRSAELRANAGRIDAQGISHPDMDLKALVVLHTEVRTVLKRFCDGGEYGGIFDATEDALDTNAIQTFELRSLLQRPRLLGPVLRYVFAQLEHQMSTDAPMLLLIDDAAIPWAVPKIQEKSKEWMMTTRKKSVSLGFMTHSLSQVFESPLGALLEEGCPTRFFLPMKSAMEPNIAAIYRKMGLTDNAIRTIATARPQRDVYYACTELGQRLFHLPLGPLALTCLARNAAEDHILMDTLLAQEGREGFAAAWLQAQKFEAEATILEEQYHATNRATDTHHAWATDNL